MTNEQEPNVLAINGSERSAGDTAAVLGVCRELFADQGIRLDVVQLADLDMGPCGPCGDCNSRMQQCGVDDGVLGVVEAMQRADGVLYATPVHGFGTASLMQAFLERAGVGYLRFDRPLANKVGGAIAVARRYSHDSVIAQLNQNILLNRMLLAGSGFPAVLTTAGGRSPLDDHEGMEAVRALVARMGDLIRLLRASDPAMLRPNSANERDGLDSAFS
jgi:multimeric flavodoxin WrbA